jgi:hypothetical protein
MVRDDHAAWVADGAVTVDEPVCGEVTEGDDVPKAVVEGVEDVDELPGRVVSASEVLGAGAAWRGGRSLTWASAALTICQVSPVARAATSTHAPAIAHLFMTPFFPACGVVLSTRHQAFLKARGLVTIGG